MTDFVYPSTDDPIAVRAALRQRLLAIAREVRHWPAGNITDQAIGDALDKAMEQAFEAVDLGVPAQIIAAVPALEEAYAAALAFVPAGETDAPALEAGEAPAPALEPPAPPAPDAPAPAPEAPAPEAPAPGA